MTARLRLRPLGLGYALVKFFKVSFLVMLFYLVQTTVVPHMRINGIAPNLFMVCSAIMTVSYGKKYAFASGAVFGILLETMLPSLRIFNLVIYPALTLLCAQIFADMSELRRELLRIRIAQRQAESRIVSVGIAQRRKALRLDFRRKSADDMEPHLRIFLNALLLTFLYEVIVLMYTALDGVGIEFHHIVRVLQSVLYTAVWCLAMFPARLFLGFYTKRFRRKKREDGLGDEVATSEKLLRELSLEPDLPSLSAAFDKDSAIKEDAPIAAEPAGQEKKGDPFGEETAAEDTKGEGTEPRADREWDNGAAGGTVTQELQGKETSHEV